MPGDGEAEEGVDMGKGLASKRGRWKRPGAETRFSSFIRAAPHGGKGGPQKKVGKTAAHACSPITQSLEQLILSLN